MLIGQFYTVSPVMSQAIMALRFLLPATLAKAM
jgi:hypothetical protein